MRAGIRTLAITSVVAYAVSTAVIYWWLTHGPYPESAWP